MNSIPELGCSKCRYSTGGCARCRNPRFRPKTDVPKEELRQAVADQRRQQAQLKRASQQQRRKRESNTRGEQQRELLLNRLRRQLSSNDSEQQQEHPSRQQKRRRQSSNDTPSHKQSVDRQSSPPITTHQPPSKFRRTNRPSPQPSLEEPLEQPMDIDVEIKHPHQPSTSLESNATKRTFLDLLTDNMTKRREARLSSDPSSPSKELSKLLPPAKRQRRQSITSPQITDEDPRKTLWEPPVSPYGLIEEELYDDPWKLLVSCMLLNKTTGTQVRKCIWEFFSLYPTPQAAIAADTSKIENLIQPLGIHRKRAVSLQRFSEEYLHNDWTDPEELYGIGKYASDAYYIFCRGVWRDIHPEDKDLKKYKEWLEQNEGLGTGLIRHKTVPEIHSKGVPSNSS